MDAPQNTRCIFFTKTARLAREAVQTAYLSGKSKVDKRSAIDSILQRQKQGCKQKLAAIATARLANEGQVTGMP